MNITPISDYLAIAKSRVLTQFKNSANVNSLLDVLVTPVQAYENVLIQVLQNRWIDTAAGVQLDGLASIVGTSRQGMTDDQLKQAIRFQIAINTSTGAPPSVIDILKIVTGATIVEMSEYFPACIDAYVNTDNINDYVISTIYKILSAGVCFRLRIGVHPFGFYGDQTAFPLGSTDIPDDPLVGNFVAVVNQ